MSAPSIQLFVSDVDGTLVRPDKTLAQATIDAFGRLRAAGVLATLISARPPSGMLRLAKALDIQGPLGAFNGGTVIDAQGAVLNAQHLAPQVVAAALAKLDSAGVDVWLFAHGLWYSRNADGAHTDHERLAADTEPTLIADFLRVEQVDKIVGVSDDHASLERLEAEVIAAVGSAATVARSQPYYLDITAPAANKGDGIAAIAQAAKVALSRVAAIGDMPNDLPMFARAGLSIAMGQAPEAVRVAARFVTASNQDDGVALAIDRYILGPEGLA
jgi:Cof subfamily protein (haloacid dehalogenase superfamily)